MSVPRKGDLFLFVESLAYGCGERNLHYNTSSAICQEKNRKKIKKVFFLKPLTIQERCAIIKTQRRKERVLCGTIWVIAVGPGLRSRVKRGVIPRFLFWAARPHSCGREFYYITSLGVLSREKSKKNKIKKFPKTLDKSSFVCYN